MCKEDKDEQFYDTMDEFKKAYKAYSDLLVYGTVVLVSTENGGVKRLKPSDVLIAFTEVHELD